MSQTHTLKESKFGKPFPASVCLNAIRYKIEEHDGCVRFTEESPIWGHGGSFYFWQPDKYAGWYVENNPEYGNGNKMNPSTMHAAFKCVCDYRGDCFGRDPFVDGSITAVYHE